MANVSGGKIVWDLDVDDSKFTAKMKKVSTAAKAAGEEINRSLSGRRSSIGKDVANSADEAANSTRRLATAVTAGVAAYQAITTVLRSAKQLMTDSVDSVNRYQSALLGLNSVAGAFGQDQNAANDAAKRLASDGLMTVAEAATGLKNLLATGFSLDQAIELMNAFKNSAAFGRQSALSFGQAVTSATEGVKNGNSILVDNAGVTKNLSVILTEAGLSQQDLMNATTDANVRLALYNGILRETAPQLGNAAQLTQTYAGDQAKLGATTEIVKQQIGGVVQVISGGLIRSLNDALGNNQRMIISLGGTVVTLGALAAAIFVGVKAFQALNFASLIAAAMNPIILALTAVALLLGVTLYQAFNDLQDQAAQANSELLDTSKTMGTKMPPAAKKASKAAQDLADRLAEIDRQIAKVNRDFQENLAEMVRSHQDKVREIQKQIADETKSFNEAAADREKDYNKEQGRAKDAYEDRVADIQKQIDKELASSGNANSARMQELVSSLSDEKREFEKATADRKSEYDEETAKAKTAYDERTANFTTQLNEEQALLDKHAADVAATRDTILLDEIDKLKRSHTEQLDSLNRQKQEAIKNAQETTGGIVSEYAKLPSAIQSALNTPMDSIGKSLGATFADALVTKLGDIATAGVFRIARDILAKADKSLDSIERSLAQAQAQYDAGKITKERLNQIRASAYEGLTNKAAGGPVKAGQPYVVGDNPDGSWNKTTELFVPKTSGTIIPSGMLEDSVTRGSSQGSQINVEQNIYNNVDLERGLRDLAWRLAN